MGWVSELDLAVIHLTARSFDGNSLQLYKLKFNWTIANIRTYPDSPVLEQVENCVLGMGHFSFDIAIFLLPRNFIRMYLLWGGVLSLKYERTFCISTDERKFCLPTDASPHFSKIKSYKSKSLVSHLTLKRLKGVFFRAHLIGECVTESGLQPTISVCLHITPMV